VAVALESAAPVQLGQATKPLPLQSLTGPVELGEVLLDAGVWKIGQGLRSERVDGRTELAHLSSLSNIRSYVS